MAEQAGFSSSAPKRKLAEKPLESTEQSDPDEPELTGDEELQNAFRLLNGTPLPDNYFKKVLAGRLKEDDGKGALVLLQLLMKFRMPVELFIKCQVLKQPIPHVSANFVCSFMKRIDVVERTNKDLEEVKREGDLVHWMAGV
ncbi:hypothetical protein HDV00_005274 [Rhizophlyctis rosea]|nr:hypothetical protein HDV00_005274 [Rhizophlyctis rosea]